MADNTSNRGQQDRVRVNGNEDYEVNYIAVKLGVSTQAVKDAIEKVGNNREKIEEHLRGQNIGR